MAKYSKDKIKLMEQERQRRIDALPEVQLWGTGQDGEMWEHPHGQYIRHADYEAKTEWILAENARLCMGDTWFEQRRGYESEVMRLQLHVERGRELLHKVTSSIGQKQGERDLATTRLEALNKMLVSYLTQNGKETQIIIDLDGMKQYDGSRVLDVRIEGRKMIIGTKENIEEGADGIEQTLVSTPDQEDEPTGDSQGDRNNETEGISSDQGTPD